MLVVGQWREGLHNCCHIGEAQQVSTMQWHPKGGSCGSRLTGQVHCVEHVGSNQDGRGVEETGRGSSLGWTLSNGWLRECA